MRALAILALVCGAAHAEPAPPDAIALLPLDADARLELYGQPVASEIARALGAGHLDVVVVGPKMAVPERAKLIVDGVIGSKGDTVVLTLRVRNPRDGTVLATVSATAPALANIDRAAADVSARVLPAVREQLAALAKPIEHVEPHMPPVPVAPPRVPRVAFAVDDAGSGTTPLAVALRTAVPAYVRAHHREPDAATNIVAPPKSPDLARGDVALAFRVRGYTVAPGAVPLARARVQVQIRTAAGTVFDRVVVTDSVVGDKGLAPAALAERVAREVLDIVRPHLQRAEPSWQ